MIHMVGLFHRICLSGEKKKIRLSVCSSVSLTPSYFKIDDFIFEITEENAFRKITTQ